MEDFNYEKSQEAWSRNPAEEERLFGTSIIDIYCIENSFGVFDYNISIYE